MTKYLQHPKLLSKILVSVLCLMALCSLSLPSAAQSTFPNRPVKLVVPFVPGGTLDVLARLLAKHMQDSLGQAVVVENRPGAGSVLGVDHVAKSTPDGYTLLMNAATPMVTVVHLQKTPYNLLKDMTGVAQTSTFDYVLAANQKSGITSMQDLINKAKAEPGKLNYASAGSGSGQHMLVELVRSLAGIDVQHIPYKGNAPAMQALLSGEVSFIFDTTLGINTQLPGGRIRPLMTSSPKPLAAFPGLPTMDSLFPGNSTQGWHGVFAPAATPKDVLQTLANAIQKAVNSPELSAKLRELGLEPSNLSGDGFNDLIRRDFERWGQVIRNNNIKAD